jgi:hypothetical protein
MKNRREEFRVGLHPLYLPLYDALCAELSLDWNPISGLRTFEAQEALYAKGRTAPGVIVTNALPGSSFHNYGLATDWAYFPNGKYLALSSEDERWKVYVSACKKVGVRCLSFEIPHNEYPLSFPIKLLREAYASGGQSAVDSLLNEKENKNG